MLEYEIIISEIVFGMVHGWPYKKFQKIPHYTSSHYVKGAKEVA
jgi:hypothetical protein